MSADNGVYVLETNGSKPGDFEYRVKEMCAIDNLYSDNVSNKETRNSDVLIANARKMWDKCSVLFRKDEAIVLANYYENQHRKERGYNTEYGVQFLKIDRSFTQEVSQPAARKPCEARKAIMEFFADNGPIASAVLRAYNKLDYNQSYYGETDLDFDSNVDEYLSVAKRTVDRFKAKKDITEAYCFATKGKLTEEEIQASVSYLVEILADLS